MKKIFNILVFAFLLCNATHLLAQTEPEDVAIANDNFQDLYFESLKQKAIENYDKSISALEKCLKIEPNNENVYFLLGKNYLLQKDYKRAYDSFEKATQINPKNQWFWVGMYDVCYETKDYNQAVIIVEKLIEFKQEYKEDLVSLFMYSQQFDKALTLINELNDKVGKSEKRDLYKAEILLDAKFQGPEKTNLLDQIQKNPKVESNYLDLILLYSKSNQVEKANEIAKKLEQEIPNSDWAQVSLFKFHINNNDGEKAVKAMDIVFASNKIDNKIKHRILNEFLIFVKNNPKYSSNLEKAIDYFKNDKTVNVAKELGKYYQNQKDWDNAIKFYELDFKNNSEQDLETTLLLFQCYTEKQQFDILAKRAEKTIELFPSQPQIYYYVGLANNQIKNYKKAKDFLEMGLDYLVDNKTLEINFNIQLGEAYSGLGDNSKKEMYFTKAENLLKKKK